MMCFLEITAERNKQRRLRMKNITALFEKYFGFVRDRVKLITSLVIRFFFPLHF